MRLRKMSSNTYQKVVLILLVLCIVSPIAIESRYESKKQEKLIGIQQSSQPLCKDDRSQSFICHCTPDDATIKAQKADCWIMKSEITRKDQQWLAFNSQTQLQHLKFTVYFNGNFTFIPTDILQPLKHLRTINIKHAHVDTLHEFVFANLTQLMNITLTNNHVKNIEMNAFANHLHLHEINLEENDIQHLDQQAFANLPKLNRLNLGSNKLEVIHDDTFEALTMLSELIMSNNSLVKLRRGMFKGLGNLKILNLNYNELVHIGDTVFAELWSLQELSLEHNKIDKISERAFDGLNNLQRLTLESNNLKTLERGLFTGVPALIYLNLIKNSLETITYTNVLPLMDNLVNNTNSLLDITENKFICDCRMSWLLDLKIKTKSEILQSSLDYVECTMKMSKETMRKVHKSDHNSIERSPSNDEYDSDYEDGEEEVESRVVNLMELKPHNLTCSDDTKDPTELPLSRESIGFDMSWIKYHSESSKSPSINVSSIIFTSLFICHTLGRLH